MSEALDAQAEAAAFLKAIAKAGQLLVDEFAMDDDESEILAARCIAAFIRSLAAGAPGSTSMIYAEALECFADTLETQA